MSIFVCLFLNTRAPMQVQRKEILCTLPGHTDRVNAVRWISKNQRGKIEQARTIYIYIYVCVCVFRERRKLDELSANCDRVLKYAYRIWLLA